MWYPMRQNCRRGIYIGAQDHPQVLEPNEGHLQESYQRLLSMDILNK